MRKRLSAERENAVLKTYFVLTEVQGLRGMSTYPGNHCAHTLPSLPEFRNGPAVAKQCLSGVDRKAEMEWIVLEGVRPCLKSDQGTVIHSLRTHRTELKYGTIGGDQGGATNVAIKTRESIELVQFISKWSDSQRLRAHIRSCAHRHSETDCQLQ